MQITRSIWDVKNIAIDERFAAAESTHTGGRQAELFSSDNATVVLRHFQWMREYAIEEAPPRPPLVGLPGGPGAVMHDSNLRVRHHVAGAGAASLGAYGGRGVSTPNMDRVICTSSLFRE